MRASFVAIFLGSPMASTTHTASTSMQLMEDGRFGKGTRVSVMMTV